MKAQIFVKQEGKKGTKAVVLGEKVSRALYAAFTGRVEDGKYHKSERPDKVNVKEVIASCNALSAHWDDLTNKFGDVLHVIIDDYKCKRETRTNDGETIVTESGEYEGRTTIQNLNMVAMLTGIARDLASDEGSLSKATRELVNLAVTREAIGFNPNPRGRKSSSPVNQSELESDILGELGL